MIFLFSADFFKVIFLNFFQEHHQNVKQLGSRLCQVLSGTILLVKIVREGASRQICKNMINSPICFSDELVFDESQVFTDTESD